MNWIDRLLRRIFPFFAIRNASGDIYMIRYKPFRCPWFKVFLHHILRSDEDLELHDHPWSFLSFVLWNGYLELLPNGISRKIRAWDIVRHKATDAHRLILRKPAWTLVFIAGNPEKKRLWGFHSRSGWLSWTDFLDLKYGKGNWTPL